MTQSYDELMAENARLREQLAEVTESCENAIKQITGQAETSLLVSKLNSAEKELESTRAEVKALKAALVEEFKTEDEALTSLSYVFEWHKVPGDISFIGWLCITLDSALAEAKRLREALEPLSRLTHLLESNPPDGRTFSIVVSAASIRKARAAIDEKVTP